MSSQGTRFSRADGPGKPPSDTPDATRTPPDARFLDWLAGFIDGEGCFLIYRRFDGVYSTRFRLCLRDDDEAILHEILALTGIGALTHAGVNGTSNPQATWFIDTKGGCAALVRMLDEHPLRARKAQDYAVWREAVAEWHRLGGRGNWARMAALKDQLSACRGYDAAPPNPLPPDPQLQLAALGHDWHGAFCAACGADEASSFADVFCPGFEAAP